jgi:DNA polymerase III alpha subunit (gram-positive type)
MAGRKLSILENIQNNWKSYDNDNWISIKTTYGILNYNKNHFTNLPVPHLLILRNYTVVSFSTSGSGFDDHDILEICAIKYRQHEEIGSFRKIIKPIGKVSRKVLHRKKIDAKILENEPELLEIMKQFNKFIKNDLIIFNNPLPFHVYLMRLIPYLFIDPMKFLDISIMYKGLFPNKNYYPLADYSIQTLNYFLKLNIDINDEYNRCKIIQQGFLYLQEILIEEYLDDDSYTNEKVEVYLDKEKYRRMSKDDVREFIKKYKGKSYSDFFVSDHVVNKREVDLINISLGNPRAINVDRKKYSTNYTIIDIETTGLNNNDDYILQISALRIRNNKKVDEFDTFVYTDEKNLKNDAMAINGITYKDIENAPKLEVAINNFLNFLDYEGKLDEEILLGFNVLFDINFINEKTSSKLSNKFFDVLPLAQLKFKDKSEKPDNYQLINICKFYKMDFSFHKGLEDCKACFEVFKRLKKE